MTDQTPEPPAVAAPPSTAIAATNTGGVIVAPELKGTGVRIVERDGIRSLAFTPEVFAAFNVVSPTTEVAALDPLWRPSVAMIHLNAAQHGYAGEKAGETALAKNGILALADGAGIQIHTRRMNRAQLKDSELGWTATALVRQAGGTLKELEQSKVIDLGHERDLIDDQVARSEANFAKGKPVDAAKVAERQRQRWLKERPHMDAKCETKAMLRALRAAMQLRHALPTGDFNRPWLVVRVGFTPDYSDPAQLARVIDAGLGATTALYGDRPALEAADIPEHAAEAEMIDAVDAYQAAHGASDPPEEVHDAQVMDEPETQHAAVSTPPAAEMGDEPNPEDEWQAARAAEEAAVASAQTSIEDQWRATMEAAGATTIEFGKDFKGLSIGDVFARDASYLQWIVSGKFTAKGDAQTRVKEHARHYLEGAQALGIQGGKP